MPADDTRAPRIWALLGAHRGDNNQVIALAEALGLPFETKILHYTFLRRLHTRLLGASLISLHRKSRALLAGDPPDLLIAVGHRSAPIVRALRARPGRRSRSVHLGNPRVDPAHFDMLITTPQYPVPDAPNVVRLPLALGRPATLAQIGQAAAAVLERMPHPRRLLLLGGPSRYWRLHADDIRSAVAALLEQAEHRGGSLIVLASPRTPETIIETARRALGGALVRAVLVPVEGPPSYSELLTTADAIFVTADSVSMISEALRTQKPVGLIPIRPTWAGRLRMAIMDRLRPGRPLFPRDLRYFWAELERQGFAGSVEYPIAAAIPDNVQMAADLVRRLLGWPVPPATNGHGSG